MVKRLKNATDKPLSVALVTAAAALVSSNTENRILNVTGPEAISGHDIAQFLSEIARKRITYVPVDTAQLVGIYASFGMPHGVAQALASFDTASAEGEYSQTSSTVRDLTGQAPTSLKQFLEDHFWQNVNLSW